MAAPFFEAEKRDKVLDLIRRAIANPANAKEVAEQIAKDWFPRVRVDSKGNTEFAIGDDVKR